MAESTPKHKITEIKLCKWIRQKANLIVIKQRKGAWSRKLQSIRFFVPKKGLCVEMKYN